MSRGVRIHQDVSRGDCMWKDRTGDMADEFRREQEMPSSIKVLEMVKVCLHTLPTRIASEYNNAMLGRTIHNKICFALEFSSPKIS